MPTTLSVPTIPSADLLGAQQRHGADCGQVSCTCCGAIVRDTPEENASFSVVPYPHDLGMGLCRPCGGTVDLPAALEAQALQRIATQEPDEEGTGPDAVTRRRLGWAMCTFVDARVAVLREKLAPANLAKLNAMPYAQQAALVSRMVDRGLMI